MSNTESSTPADGFGELGISEPIGRALASLGYEEPTPIQKEAIPPLIAGRDLLGQAATGTGKTAAFALPILEHLAGDPDRRRGGERISALILVPTRELAMQVAEAIHKYGKPVGARVLPVYGGQSIHQQLTVLRRGVDVVVATPGRALDHIRRSTLDLSKLRTVVLDEADEMLDMGFAEDLDAILEAAPTPRQTALFSATLAPRIRAIAKRHLKDPVNVRIEPDRAEAGTVPRVRQVAYMVQRQQKPAALGRILDIENPASALVFCRTRTEVDELTETLNGRGYRAEALHGGLSQEQRDRVMRRFREGGLDLLVATDVAARGLDIGHLSHVVNFDVPSAPDAYVHRIGRTGRAGREGVAITLAEPRESRMLRTIEQHTRQKIRIEPVPTVVDLRSRRLEKTRAAVRQAVEDGSLDQYRTIVESLGEDLDVMDVAAAAVKLAHEAGGNPRENEEEIASVAPPRDKARRAASVSPRAERHAASPARPRSSEKTAGKTAGKTDGKTAGKTAGKTKMTRIYIGLGRTAGIRPADLVGAIANEAGIPGRDIGSIEMGNGFSLVEVPESAADIVVEAMAGAKIRGKRVTVRRERFEGPTGKSKGKGKPTKGS
ncbi:MAG: DEAD/DEAH box helicase [Gemmatimonadaceae bacterium]|nr:DEAD/DEAH box helicase [Gemmatimonadaceae bacterium]